MTPEACERELDRLYRRHEGEVRRYVRLTLRDRNEVEDVVQQTFLKALRALQGGTRVERPRGWLVAIARNECRQHFRSAARRVTHVRLDEAEAAAPAEDGPTAAELRDALAQLAPNQRAALVLRELEGRSYAEIAAALELTGPAVETLLFRARRALREQLEDGGGCADAQRLLAADVLGEAQRRRLRAHVRSCAACRRLERSRRGRIAAAARRLASFLPAPSWLGSLAGGTGGKAAAVAVTAALAAGGALGPGRTGHAAPAGKVEPRPAPQLVHVDPVRRAAAPPPRPAPAPVVQKRKPAAPARRPAAPASTPAPAPAVARPEPAPAPPPRPAEPAPARPKPEPEPAEPPARPAPQSRAPAPASAPSHGPAAILQQLPPLPQVELPQVRLPRVELPPVTVSPPPLPLPQAPLPEVQLPQVTVTTPPLPLPLPLPDTKLPGL